MNYLRRMRIARARYLLERSNLTVKQICHMAGFGDQLYFSRAFRKETGMCPTVYRTQALPRYGRSYFSR
jgi:AraC-like DNA-binding protein